MTARERFIDIVSTLLVPLGRLGLRLGWWTRADVERFTQEHDRSAS